MFGYYVLVLRMVEFFDCFFDLFVEISVCDWMGDFVVDGFDVVVCFGVFELLLYCVWLLFEMCVLICVLVVYVECYGELCYLCDFVYGYCCVLICDLVMGWLYEWEFYWGKEVVLFDVGG